jgi:Peptidase family M23/Putative Ig domain
MRYFGSLFRPIRAGRCVSGAVAATICFTFGLLGSPLAQAHSINVAPHGVCEGAVEQVANRGAGRFALRVQPLVAPVRCIFNAPGAPLVLPRLGPGTPVVTAPVSPTPSPTATPPPAGGALPPTVLAGINPGFAYFPPGDLHPLDKNRGRVGDRKVYLPNIIFPLRLDAGGELRPPGKHAFMNSQVRNYGGGDIGGDQCNPANYNPMLQRDNYCEGRPHDMPLCPSGTGHQGQDIRPPACEDNKWDAVAVVDGTITQITSNTTVRLKGEDGTDYYYLHMHPDSIKVSNGQAVRKGHVLGRVSNFMNGGRDTTRHLHFHASQLIRVGTETKRVYVPVFTSLIAAYRQQKGLSSGIDPTGQLIVDPALEIGAAAIVGQPQVPFVAWPIPNVTGNDGSALANLTVAKYFKARDAALPVRYAATGLPSGLSIAADSGVIKGKLADSASRGGTNGSYTVAIVATDKLGETSTQSFTITAVTTPPVIGTATRGKFFKDGGRVLVDAGAAYLNPSNSTLTFAATGLPKDLAINPATGRISGRLSNTASRGGNGGVYAVTVAGSDGRNPAVNQRFTITVQRQSDPNAAPPDAPPPVIAQALPSLRVGNGQEITAIDVASGFKSGGAVTERLRYSALTLPTGLAINASTGQITGKMGPDASRGGNNGSYVVTVAATNLDGESVSQSFIITARNQAPVVTLPTVNKTYEDGEAVTIPVAGAFDAPATSTLLYKSKGLPDGLIMDSGTGLIKGRLGSAASQGGVAGVYTVTASVDDGNGGVASETFTITARPIPVPVAVPVVTPPTPAPTPVVPPVAPPVVVIAPVVTPEPPVVIAQPVAPTPPTPTPPVVIVTPPAPTPPPTPPVVVVAPPAPPPATPPTARGALAAQSVVAGATLTPIETAALFAVGGASPGPLTYSATGLPPALKIDSATGQIAGVIAPTAAVGGVNGRYDVIVTARDGASTLSATQAFVIRVREPAVVTAPPVPAPAQPDPAPVVIEPQSDTKPKTWAGWAWDKASGTWQWVSGWWTKKP